MHKWVFSAITIVVISILVLMIGPTITAEPPLVDNSKTISRFGDNVEIILLNHIPGHHGLETGSATLTGAQVVPPVITSTTGSAKFSHNKATDPLKLRLVVKNGVGAEEAHIHCGMPGTNGPVGVTLFSGAAVNTGKGGKPLVNSVLNRPDGGNLCGYSSMEEVLADMRAGMTYVDVHTVGNPGGEIRGQITYG